MRTFSSAAMSHSAPHSRNSAVQPMGSKICAAEHHQSHSWALLIRQLLQYTCKDSVQADNHVQTPTEGPSPHLTTKEETMATCILYQNHAVP